MPEAGAGQVVAKLEIAPPERLAVGRGNAFVLGGYCYQPGARTCRLFVEIAGERQPAQHTRLPRADVFELHGEAPGGAEAYRSGFVTVAELTPRSGMEHSDVHLALALEGGREERVRVGEIELDAALTPPADFEVPDFPESRGDRVAIALATFNPPGEFLRRQLESLRAQTHRNWICVISDDCSDPESLERLRSELAGDPRFALSRSSRRLGFYGNFERALSMVPPSSDFVTLCDQDDSWHDDKLTRLLAGIEAEEQLIYSDSRLVTPEGRLISDSFWTNRRNNHTNFASLLLANSVTGAASLFRRELLEDALPFPPQLADPFHDHWLAVVAMARGEIGYIDAPLWDYVQHDHAVIGHSEANRRPRPVRQHVLERLRNPGDGSRVAYYYNWHQQLLSTHVLKLRCWQRMTPPKRRALQRVLSADDGVIGIPWLLGRRIRRLWGNNETLDRELFYAYALGRRRLVSMLTLGRRRPGRLLPRDARIPPAPRFR